MEGSPLTNYIHVVTVFVIRLYIFLAHLFEYICGGAKHQL